MPVAGKDLRSTLLHFGLHFGLQCGCILFAVVIICGSAPTAGAEDETVHIVTLDWPPYTGRDLPGGGATTELIRKAFESAGHRIDVTYHSWPKAIEAARKGRDGAVAYYPGFHCRHRSGFAPSLPIGSGPLGFAEHVEAPLSWDSLDAIGERKLKIGTVIGYANTDEFDAKVGIGWIHAIPSKTDVENLRKLLRKRVDAAVIDKFVLAYLKRTDETLRGDGDKLRFNEKLLENKTLFLCFRDDAEGTRLLHLFNQGLEAVNGNSIVEDYFAEIFRD